MQGGSVCVSFELQQIPVTSVYRLSWLAVSSLASLPALTMFLGLCKIDARLRMAPFHAASRQGD
jgi:hypothetical protein